MDRWPPKEEIDQEQKVALLAIQYIEECERVPRDEWQVKLLYRDLKQAVIDLKEWYRQ